MKLRTLLWFGEKALRLMITLARTNTKRVIQHDSKRIRKIKHRLFGIGLIAIAIGLPNIGGVLEAPRNCMYAGLGPGQPQAYIIVQPFTSHLVVTITIRHSKCDRPDGRG